MVQNKDTVTMMNFLLGSKDKPKKDKSKSKNKDKSKKRKTSVSRSRSKSKSSKVKSSSKRVPSPTDKSVYASGDKIMVSVSFPATSDQASVKDRLDGAVMIGTKKEQKPSVIIDLLDDEKPYKVIEEEKELVDIANSDNEKENTAPDKSPVSHPTPSKGPMTPPEPDRYDPFDPTESPDNEPESLPADDNADSTPPLQPSTPPPESPSPTKLSSPGVKLTSSPDKQPTPVSSAKKRQPLYTSLPANVSAALPLTIK